MDLIGKTLKNRYRVDAAVGHGGMAEVFKVWDQDRNTFLAMKLLHEDLAQDPAFIRRFKREAKTLEKLQHPNIVRFYGLEQDEAMAFMLMEYIDGTNLRTEIFAHQKRPFPNKLVLDIMQPICSALHYAHLQGMVHCDIKPANILIDNNGRILLADFGIARMAEGSTGTMVGTGTPAYMAPEIVIGGAPTVQTDIYALGITLYEMLTGERPFTGEMSTESGTTAQKICWEQRNLNPPPPSRYNRAIEESLEAVIMKCLEKSPEKRYANVQEFIDELEKALLVKNIEEAPTVATIVEAAKPNSMEEKMQPPTPVSGNPIPPNQGQQPNPYQQPVQGPQPVQGQTGYPPVPPYPQQPQQPYPGTPAPYPQQGVPGYPPYYPAPVKKKSKVWIPILIVGLVLLAVGFTFLAITGIFPARPEISMSVSSYDFGDQMLGTEYDGKTINITNSGHGKLSIEDLSLSDDSNFIIDNDRCSGKTLGREESCSFDVFFTPQKDGSLDSSIEVVTNTKTSPDSIELSGKAVIPPCDVAILGAIGDDWIADVKAKLQGTGFFDSIDTYNVMDYEIPTLSTLQQYQAVFVFSDASFYGGDDMGDVLADYVDSGGGVVVAAFSYNSETPMGMSGRMVTDGYLPFSSGDYNYGSEMTMVADIPESPILKGVNSFSGGSESWYDDVYLINSATLIAHWDNGVPMIATLEFGDARVVGLDFYPVSGDMRDGFWDSSTDGALIMGNALAWAGHCYTGQ